jgi:hypothetical protein
MAKHTTSMVAISSSRRVATVGMTKSNSSSSSNNNMVDTADMISNNSKRPLRQILPPHRLPQLSRLIQMLQYVPFEPFPSRMAVLKRLFQPVTGPFGVDFKLDTTSLELTCTPESTVLEFLSDSMLELLVRLCPLALFHQSVLFLPRRITCKMTS